MSGAEWSLIWEILGFAGLLVLSAFFSGSETALFNLKRNELEKLKHDLAPSSRLIVRLMNSPRRLLITILTGNTFVNVALAALSALITARVAANLGLNQVIALLIATLILTLVLVILGEITPKVFAVRHSLGFASRIAGIMTLIFRVFSPIAAVLYRLVERLLNLLHIKPEEAFTSDEEIKALVELGQVKGVIGEEERDMIHSVIEFGDTKAREIMIPRPDVSMLNTEMDRDEVLEMIRSAGFSKFPLYRDQIDNIRGVIFIKDLLPYLHGPSQRINLERLARPAMFVPEHQFIDEVLRDMQRQKQKVAMVVDEYGGISGMVAVEDIVEEVLGDMQDELDTPEEQEIRKLDEKTYKIAASANLDEVAEALGVEFPEERDYDSMAGYLLDVAGRIPDEGEEIDLFPFRFIVEQVQKNRIESVRAIRFLPSGEVTE